MSNVITKPGKYVQQSDGRLSTVEHVSGGWAFGFDAEGDVDIWNCHTGEARFTYKLSGPFHEPPDGFQLMPKEYVAKDGDMYTWGSASGWTECPKGLSIADSFKGSGFIASPIPKPAKPDPGEGWRLLEEGERVEYGDEFLGPKSGVWLTVSSVIGDTCSDAREMLDCAAFRRRLTKPFRISDHGCGVYETRDGREAKVSAHEPRRWQQAPWTGLIDGYAHLIGWDDEGGAPAHYDNGVDLVRYLRPLPKQETPEPQWREVGRDEVIEEDDQFAFRRNTTNVHHDDYFISARSFAGKTLNQEDADHPGSSPRIARRRVPKQETWTCTGEVAFEPCDKNEDGAHIARLNQKMQWCRIVVKWTNGTDSEWRPLTAAF